MPVQKEKDQRPNILYSCYSRTSRDGEHFVPEHIFGYTLAGSSETYLDGNTYVFKEGDFRFFRRNQLAKYAKYPPANGGEYRSISVAIDQETLRSISEEYNLHMTMPYTGRNVLHLQPNVLFTNFINSLEPYLHSTGQLGEALVKLKVKEIVMILLQTNPELK
ncbi:MAG: AraC family ligand binding domain-containing protein, partial [Bacteroidetes bacterium]|nr:AraC family ligand binding domain-containing protein [Bacteroidota bacterium]